MPMTEDEIMKAMRVAGFSTREQQAMTYTSWKDGIDIEKPSHSLTAFVQLVERACSSLAPEKSDGG